jgi:hypothetical protein
MLPKRRFGKDWQKRKSRFLIYFSMVCSPNRALTPFKSASFEIWISSFVNPSQIFGWEGYFCYSFQNLRLWSIKVMKMTSKVELREFKCLNHSFIIDFSYLRYSYPFRPRAEKVRLWWRKIFMPSSSTWLKKCDFGDKRSSCHHHLHGQYELVLTPLKSASKTHSKTLVRPFQIFVWGASKLSWTDTSSMAVALSLTRRAIIACVGQTRRHAIITCFKCGKQHLRDLLTLYWQGLNYASCMLTPNLGSKMRCSASDTVRAWLRRRRHRQCASQGSSFWSWTVQHSAVSLELTRITIWWYQDDVSVDSLSNSQSDAVIMDFPC